MSNKNLDAGTTRSCEGESGAGEGVGIEVSKVFEGDGAGGGILSAPGPRSLTGFAVPLFVLLFSSKK